MGEDSEPLPGQSFEQTTYKRRDGVVCVLWTSTQAYKYCGIPPRRLRRLASAGEIECKLENGRYYFTKVWLDKYVSTSHGPSIGGSLRYTAYSEY